MASRPQPDREFAPANFRHQPDSPPLQEVRAAPPVGFEPATCGLEDRSWSAVPLARADLHDLGRRSVRPTYAEFGTPFGTRNGRHAQGPTPPNGNNVCAPRVPAGTVGRRQSRRQPRSGATAIIIRTAAAPSARPAISDSELRPASPHAPPALEHDTSGRRSCFRPKKRAPRGMLLGVSFAGAGGALADWSRLPAAVNGRTRQGHGGGSLES